MSACAGVAGSRVWGFYIIAAVFNAAGAVAFVLLACLLIYYSDRLQESSDIIKYYSTIENINIIEEDIWCA